MKSIFGDMNISVRFGIDSLKGLGNSTSLWQVVEAFVRQSEGIASRVAFGPSGAIIPAFESV